MLRIARVAYSTLKPGVQIKVYSKCQSLTVPKFTTTSRFYSSEEDDGDKDARRYRGKCRPDSGKSCRPPPPPVKKYIPPLNVCQTPNLMSQCPQPDCPWEEKAKKNKRTGLIILALGILATAISLFIFKMAIKPEELPPKKAEDKRRRRPPVKTPSTSADIPKDVPYLLIGGGTASFSAFRAIKSADPQAKVLVVGAEEHFPYMRPPLSKEMWFNEDAEQVKKLIFKQWNGSERSLLYEPKEFYTRCKELKNSQNGGVAVARGWSIKRIDVINRIAYLEDDSEIRYGKCLIATGALPKNLDIFASAAADPKVDERVSLFRDIMDFEEMYDVMDTAQHIAIVGGGFLGSELACALARRGKKKRQVVTQIFREAGNMGKILPEYLSYWTTEKVKGEGVIVVNNSEVVGVKSVENKVCLTLNTGKQLLVDHVIVAVGVEANTELAEKSDLEVDPELGGYLVNTELQARSHLYIAGDCACFYDTKLGRRRVEHHDHAVISGRLAGENMTGAEKPYLHQSMFWSDLGPEVGYEAIGIVDSSLPTVGVFAKATDKDNPQAVVTATDEGIRSKTEEIPPECKKYADKDKLKAEKAARMPSSMPQDNEDFGKGVIFYLRDDIVVGIVLWNVFNRMSIARQVLKDERKYEDLNEVAKLFNIHEE